MDTSNHIADEDLASLTEPGAVVVDREIVAHLALCPRCLAIYAEYVRSRAQFLQAPNAEMPPADLVDRVLDLAQPRPRRVAVATRARRRWVPAAAAAAAVLAALTFAWFRPTTSRAPVSQDLRVRLSTLMRTNSPGGLLYADSLLPLASGMRGVGGPSSELDLEPLRRAQRARTPDPESTYWLIAGLLAQGQLRDADAYIRQALLRFPREARFHNLAAILAYVSNDLEQAERELQAALEIERGPAVLLNLAQVLTEMGRSAEAEAYLSEVVRSHSATPAAHLARQRASVGRNAPHR